MPTSTANRLSPGPEKTPPRHTSNNCNNGLRHHEWKIERHFTKATLHPYDEIEWDVRDARITNSKGDSVFEQCGIEVPDFWSENATNIVASKYFAGKKDSPERESSVRHLLDRVVKTTRDWGEADGYLRTPEEADAFEHELTFILLHQMAAFNSPVWFNLGVDPHPQVSACFINSVEDSMESILELVKTEGMLFKHGSGCGTNLSSIRSSREMVSRGGKASGPVSFMKGYDAFSSVIKSGGKTRRAAKMQILNVGHPDIIEFIECKRNEERKAWALIEAGYGNDIDGEAYSSVFFQNSNLSVRVNDEFMQAVEADGEWQTRAVRGGEAVETFRARDLFHRICDAAHSCGDPGLQFDDAMNHWNPCADTTRINASNPCSEYVFVDDSACNLASLNLMKFRRADGSFDIEGFSHCVHLLITAQEIFVSRASYPTEKICRNSQRYRPLGLGYANLGALLMANGLPYDSEEGRAFATSITALMTGQAYKISAQLAERVGPFEAFEDNKISFLKVIGRHRESFHLLDTALVPAALLSAAQTAWDDAIDSGERYGYRNAQTTVLAPTGTIAFMMDCDTTGIEPDLGLFKYKNLVGGGTMKIVNQTVSVALGRLGYSAEQRKAIQNYLDENETIERAPHLLPEHLPVFDCAFKPRNGTRFIHHRGHLQMMAAVQPFLSGAISKTVNMPESASVEDVEQVFMEAWKLGIKATTIYRDGCKQVQPLNTGKQKAGTHERDAAHAKITALPVRRRLPDERQSITHKFNIAGHDGYITVGMYPDGAPGELFITMAKEGSTVGGLVDTIATMTSIALQYGVPLEVLCRKLTNTRFEPAGITSNRDIRFAKSAVDYIFRWLSLKFGETIPHNEADPEEVAEPTKAPTNSGQDDLDAPACSDCGTIMIRSAACYTCPNCALSSGCG